jgi:hypothetical protein
MKPGATIEEARADVTSIASRISREFTEYGAAGRIFTTVPLQDDDVREMRPALLALFAGVGILLVIACVNVASLLIARAAVRSISGSSWIPGPAERRIKLPRSSGSSRTCTSARSSRISPNRCSSPNR